MENKKCFEDNIYDIYDIIYNNPQERNKITKLLTTNYRIMSVNDRGSRNDEEYMFYRGLCYSLSLFDFPETATSNKSAKKCFEKVLKINPNNQYAIVELANTICLLQNPDYSRAKKLYLQAENKYSINGLAILYGNGYGVEKNLEKAKELYEKAISLGNSLSMNNLACIYEKEKKYDESIKLYEQSVEYNNYQAMINLANVIYCHTDDFLRPYELSTYILNNTDSRDLQYRAQGIIDRIKRSYKPFDILKFNIAQRDENRRLQKEIVNLKQEMEELRQICYMPGGILSKNCEKHFYESAEQVNNMDLD